MVNCRAVHRETIFESENNMNNIDGYLSNIVRIEIWILIIFVFAADFLIVTSWIKTEECARQ
jgi:hypothetical protein